MRPRIGSDHVSLLRNRGGSRLHTLHAHQLEQCIVESLEERGVKEREGEKREMIEKDERRETCVSE